MKNTLKKAFVRLFEYSGVAQVHSRLNAIGNRNSVSIWISKTSGSSFLISTVALAPPQLRTCDEKSPKKYFRGI